MSLTRIYDQLIVADDAEEGKNQMLTPDEGVTSSSPEHIRKADPSEGQAPTLDQQRQALTIFQKQNKSALGKLGSNFLSSASEDSEADKRGPRAPNKNASLHVNKTPSLGGPPLHKSRKAIGEVRFKKTPREEDASSVSERLKLSLEAFKSNKFLPSGTDRSLNNNSVLSGKSSFRSNKHN